MEGAQRSAANESHLKLKVDSRVIQYSINNLVENLPLCYSKYCNTYFISTFKLQISHQSLSLKPVPKIDDVKVLKAE